MKGIDLRLHKCSSGKATTKGDAKAEYASMTVLEFNIFFEKVLEQKNKAITDGKFRLPKRLLSKLCSNTGSFTSNLRYIKLKQKKYISC